MAAHYPSVQRDHLSPYKHSAMKPENGRRVLGELAPNATTPRRPQHATVTGKQWSQSTSPTKRNAIVLGDEPSAKKRRNVEQGITVIPYKPLGEKTATKVSAERKVLQQPTSSIQDKSTRLVPQASNDRDSSSEGDSGRESQTSFTSLINYDLSSAHAVQAPFSKNAHSILCVGARPSRAESLRIRLRLAVYKVVTNQVHTPFDRLKIYRPVMGSPKRGIHARQERAAESKKQTVQMSSASPELPTRVEHGGPTHANVHMRASVVEADRCAMPALQTSSFKPMAAPRDGRNFVVDAGMQTPRAHGGGDFDHIRKSSESTIVADKQYS